MFGEEVMFGEEAIRFNKRAINIGAAMEFVIGAGIMGLTLAGLAYRRKFMSFAGRKCRSQFPDGASSCSATIGAEFGSHLGNVFNSISTQ